MTYRERMMIDHPNSVGARFIGGVAGCPNAWYPGTPKPEYCVNNSLDTDKCTHCWNRQIPNNDISSPQAYFDRLYAHDDVYMGYTIVIMGKSGPTGKTWLAKKLREKGFNAVEIAEDVFNNISYLDSNNHFTVNGFNKTVTIILNKPLPKEEPVRKMTVSEVEKLVGSKVEIVAED